MSIWRVLGANYEDLGVRHIVKSERSTECSQGRSSLCDLNGLMWVCNCWIGSALCLMMFLVCTGNFHQNFSMPLDPRGPYSFVEQDPHHVWARQNQQLSHMQQSHQQWCINPDEALFGSFSNVGMYSNDRGPLQVWSVCQQVLVWCVLALFSMLTSSAVLHLLNLIRKIVKLRSRYRYSNISSLLHMFVQSLFFIDDCGCGCSLQCCRLPFLG